MPLPLRPALRVIEIGCGPGAAPRGSPARVLPGGHVLAVDRSAKATRELLNAGDLIENGVLSVRTVACEDLALDPDGSLTTWRSQCGSAVSWTHPTVGERAALIADALGSGGHSSSMGGTHYGRSPSPHLRRPPTNAGTAPRCLMVCGVIGCRPPTVSPSTRGSMLPVHRMAVPGIRAISAALIAGRMRSILDGVAVPMLTDLRRRRSEILDVAHVAARPGPVFGSVATATPPKRATSTSGRPRGGAWTSRSRRPADGFASACWATMLTSPPRPGCAHVLLSVRSPTRSTCEERRRPAARHDRDVRYC